MSHSTKPSGKTEELLLVERAKNNDREALRTLIDLHKDRLFAFIWRIIRHHHDAEEVCQEAFLKAFASLGSFSTKYRFSTWLFTIAYRVCLNRMRRKRMLTGELEWATDAQKADDNSAETLESEEASRLREQVWSAVDRLSVPQRATVLLFYRHDMGCQDIARVLELPVATVKSHLHRARLRLREMLESLGDHELEQFRNHRASAG